MAKSFSRKGQGMSLNTVIIAIIVLVVLVVLIMIFTGYFGKIFTPSVKSCSSQGGQCAAACNTGDLGNQIYGAECPKSGGAQLTCCASVQTQFEREEGVASCTTQGGTCEANTKTNPSPPPATLTATCTDYGKAAFSAPGCGTGKICCK